MRSINPIRESCEMMMKNKWQYRKIGDVCVVERGSSPRPIDQFITEDGGGINWIKIGDTTESMYITETAQKIKPEGMKKSRYVEPGDFLLSNSMSFGRPYILKIDGCIHDGWLVLKDKDEIFDKRFLYYYLSSKATYQKFKHMAVGGVVNNLNSEMVRKIDVPVPSKDEQMDTADLLDKICNIISLRKRELNCLDDLIRARFIELFGDLKSNNKGWKIVNFKECADIDTNMIHEFEGYEEYPHIGIDSIEKETGRLVGYRTIAEDGVISGKYLFSSAHIIYSKIRPNLNKVAMPDFDGLCSADAYPILVKKGICNREYFGYTLRSQYFLDYILALSNRTNLPKVNKSQVEGFLLPLPPIAVQDQFAAFVHQVAKSKAAVQKALDQTQQLFDSLMQEYFG